jgi:hypothetical protein
MGKLRDPVHKYRKSIDLPGGPLKGSTSPGHRENSPLIIQISHQSLAHFGFNSFALFSFGAATYSYLSLPIVTPSSSGLASSTHAPHFVAFLLTAGLFSSLASHLYTNLFRLPRFLKMLASPARLSSPQALAAHHSILPSLGASGAIYGALTLTACAFPESVSTPCPNNTSCLDSAAMWYNLGAKLTLERRHHLHPFRVRSYRLWCSSDGRP